MHILTILKPSKKLPTKKKKKKSLLVEDNMSRRNQ